MPVAFGWRDAVVYFFFFTFCVASIVSTALPGDALMLDLLILSLRFTMCREEKFGFVFYGRLPPDTKVVLPPGEVEALPFPRMTSAAAT